MFNEPSVFQCKFPTRLVESRPTRSPAKLFPRSRQGYTIVKRGAGSSKVAGKDFQFLKLDGNSLRTFDLLYFLNFVSDQLVTLLPPLWKHLEDRNDDVKKENIYIYIKERRRRTSSKFSRSLYYLLARRMFQKFRH